MTGRVLIEEGAENGYYELHFGGVPVMQQTALQVEGRRAQGASIAQRAAAFETVMELRADR